MVPVKDLVNAQFEGSLLESFKGKDSSGNWLPAKVVSIFQHGFDCRSQARWTLSLPQYSNQRF